ncbi:hypothetical protein E2C01_023979 [Portunus trituberculatus]|uniref:Uncharacterized protein n=1 Tax=Portunus trituberculatus TaxID=210409 RepID=A0A5B7EBH6_PORTR|nr:hypothetical protein [Portunus trituberculatus]
MDTSLRTHRLHRSGRIPSHTCPRPRHPRHPRHPRPHSPPPPPSPSPPFTTATSLPNLASSPSIPHYLPYLATPPPHFLSSRHPQHLIRSFPRCSSPSLYILHLSHSCVSLRVGAPPLGTHAQGTHARALYVAAHHVPVLTCPTMNINQTCPPAIVLRGAA